jgi:hypothetical protein
MKQLYFCQIKVVSITHLIFLIPSNILNILYFFTFFSTSCHNQTVSTQFLYLLQVNYKKKDKKAQLLAFGADEEASMKSEQANTA